ncbi:MAG TPA: hypothetical protein VFX01_08970, partial [Methylophilaceae bacterium]|nr:hypothetical protein [Methylophilaceae bacterium]
AWAAWVMGAKVVILAGMDGYNGTAGFVHESVKIARDIHCPVRVMSESLTKAWPMYDPQEKFGRYAPHAGINAWLGIDGKTTIEVIKATTIRGVLQQKGQRLSVMRHEVKALLKHKMIKEV